MFYWTVNYDRYKGKQILPCESAAQALFASELAKLDGKAVAKLVNENIHL